MQDTSESKPALLALSQVGELLDVSVEAVLGLVHDRRLRGMRVGSPPQWRVVSDSLNEYLNDQTEEARLIALWRESNTASFPELWSASRQAPAEHAPAEHAPAEHAPAQHTPADHAPAQHTPAEHAPAQR